MTRPGPPSSAATPRRPLAVAAVALSVTFSLCLGCALLAWAAQPVLARSPLPLGYTAFGCAEVARGGPFQAALWWSLPEVLNAPTWMHPAGWGVCAFWLWSPRLPPQGQWLFPP